jgi:hypothetical protein
MTGKPSILPVPYDLSLTDQFKPVTKLIHYFIDRPGKRIKLEADKSEAGI